MRALMPLLLVAALGASVSAADPLAEARRLYNLGHLESAATMAREAMKVPATMESARLVLGRIYLEEYRRSGDAADLAYGREVLRAINTGALDGRERAELSIGLAEALFLDDSFGPAAEIFERVLDASVVLGAVARERVLDWWATSMDRLAQLRPRDAREAIYARLVERIELELERDPFSAPAAYWLAAASRGTGNLDRAWHAASAGWVTAVLGSDRGAALRADLDRLMTQGIIPDRAARLQPREPESAAGVMLSEWEAFKSNWTR